MGDSNKSSKFSKFELAIDGETVVTGIHYFPALTDAAVTHKPLIIFLHGGTCSAHHYDATPNLTASLLADAFSIPVIAINRPGYLGSTPLRLSEADIFHRTLGTFYHEKMLPHLWQKWGQPLGCPAIVLHAHSMGVPGTIIAAGLHAQEATKPYPLAGIVCSGWGLQMATYMDSISYPQTPAERKPWKRLLMLGQVDWNLASEEAIAALPLQGQPSAEYELEEQGNGALGRYWRTFSDLITVPVMYAFAEYDTFFAATQEHLREMEASFPKASRFDGSIVLAAPHAIEWSIMSQGWYARCFGFAMEVTALHQNLLNRNSTWTTKKH